MTNFGGIEAGGTKFVCAVGSGPDDLRDEIRFETTSPDETIGRAIRYFQEQHQKIPLAAVGIASFGPVDLQRDSPTFGFITSTPKPGWSNTDFVGRIQRALDLPVGFDTDVNAAALGEYCWGAAQGLNTFLYLTVGTGIGGGGMINGELLHGIAHPEMGHVRIPRDDGDRFAGICPFHGDCLEGVASGPALERRWGVRAEELPPEHTAWEQEARYLALALANYIFVVSPQRIVIGGGIMEQRDLLPMIHRHVFELLNGYGLPAEIIEALDDFIVMPGLGNRSGICGALALARRERGRTDTPRRQ